MLNKFTKRKKPYSAQIEVTLKCNASCPFCSIPHLPSSFSSNEMRTSQIKYIIDELAKLGVNALSFTGGEPTLRMDLPELIYHAGVKHDFINGIATNGYLMPKLFRENGSLTGLDYILLSLDYPNPEKHDKRRGLKIFEKVIQTIEYANSHEVKVILSTVVMKDNLNSLDEMCRLAEKRGCSIELYPCEDIIREFPDKQYKIDHIDDLIPSVPLWANLIRILRRRYKNILTDPLSLQIIEQGGFGGFPNYNQEILRCHVAQSYIFVRNDGIVDLPCKIHPLLSINALKYPISKLYEICEVREIIQNHDDFKFCNNCRLGCAIASSMPATWKTLASKYIQGYLNGNLK
ncbi:MAG: radical SAM protein [Candidatus Lokiarchaeota archaeon]|jgi:MoaA/NifB/PqqE/SkfB family radical SAM enzyme